MPTPAGSLGAAVVNGQLVAVGGEAPRDVINAVQSYNLTTKIWATLAPLPIARHGLAVVGLGHTLYAVGGAQRARARRVDGRRRRAGLRRRHLARRSPLAEHDP